MTFAKDANKKKDSVTFFIEAMDCDHCIKKIEKNIAFEKGVTDLKCDLSTRTAIVTYKTDKTSKTRLAAAFKKIGMEAVPVDNGAGCPVPPVKKSERCLECPPCLLNNFSTVCSVCLIIYILILYSLQKGDVQGTTE